MGSLWGVLEASEAELAGQARELRGQLELVEEALRRRVIAREVYRELLGAESEVIENGDGDVLDEGASAGAGVDLTARMTVGSEPMRALVKVFEQAGSAALRCSEVCERLGITPDHNQVEVARHRCRRLLERGVLEPAGRGLYRYALGGAR